MSVTQDISKENSWNLATLITFRFFFAFFLLHIFPFPLSYAGNIIGQNDLFSFYTNWLENLSVWTGKNILGIEYEMPTGPNGSGDTTTDYVIQLIKLLVSIVVSIFWSTIDFKRKNYNKAFLYLRTLVRYYLVSTLFFYGFGKVIPLQFSELSNFDLIKAFGDQSPMGLMWNFMEYSNTYTQFSGFAEVLAGTFLLFRRTTVFGALITIAVMFNVFMMNMSYDIPVKSYSGLLTIMGIFLLVPDIKRILNFFIFNKPVQSKIFISYFSKQKLKTIVIVIKVLAVCFLLYNTLGQMIKLREIRGQKAPKPELYGIYKIEHFIINSDTLPPLTTDTIRWKRLIIDKRYTNLQTMDEEFTRFKEKTDTITKTLQLISYTDSTDIQNLSYKLKDSIYIFESIYKCDTLRIEAKKKEREDFLLIKRGFNWINEKPFNR